MNRHFFVIEDLRVLQAEAEAAASDDPSTGCAWEAKYFNPLPDIGDAETRILTGRLHAHGPDGWATVVVGGLITPIGGAVNGGEDIADLIQRSSALETLYDFARPQLRALSGLIDGHLEVPFHSPDVSIEADSLPTEST